MTNINALVQSIQRSLLLIYYKIDFQLNNKKFKQIWPEFQSINVYPSKTSLFKHFGRQLCIKWYPQHIQLRPQCHICAEVRAQQYMQLCLNSASGISRALPSLLLYMYIFEFPDARCRPQVSLSVNLKPFQGFQVGKLKPCTYGAGMAKSRWAETPSYAKTPDLSGSIFFLARAKRSVKN